MLHCAILLLGRSRPGPAVFSSRSFTTAGADRMIVGGIAGKSLVVPFDFFYSTHSCPALTTWWHAFLYIHVRGDKHTYSSYLYMHTLHTCMHQGSAMRYVTLRNVALPSVLFHSIPSIRVHAHYIALRLWHTIAWSCIPEHIATATYHYTPLRSMTWQYMTRRLHTIAWHYIKWCMHCNITQHNGTQHA